MNHQHDASLTFARLKKAVEDKLEQIVVEDFLSFIDDQKPELWGRVQPRDYRHMMVLLTVHHDIEMVGYHELARKLHYEVHVRGNFIWHNAQLIRPPVV